MIRAPGAALSSALPGSLARRTMDEQAFAGLEAQLGSTPPAGLARLHTDELSDLTAALRDARRRQAAEIDAVADRALSFIPRLLRGPIRRIVG